MKINGPHLDKIQQIYQQQKKNMEKKQGQKTDKMNISNKAQDIKKLQKQVKEIPDIRQKKVAQLKEKIANGDYEVDSRLIAEKILSRTGQE